MNKKKMAIIGVAVVALIGIVVGVVIAMNSNQEPEKPEEKTEIVDDPKSFSINKLKFKLDTEKEFEGMKYEISKDFKEAKHDISTHYVEYRYIQKDDTNLLFFRIFHYVGKDVAAVVKDFDLGDITLSSGQTDNLEYKFYSEPRDDGTVHFYFITKGADTYAIHITSRYDIREFETKVMKTLRF